jgi:hypothetical protein
VLVELFAEPSDCALWFGIGYGDSSKEEAACRIVTSSFVEGKEKQFPFTLPSGARGRVRTAQEAESLASTERALGRILILYLRRSSMRVWLPAKLLLSCLALCGVIWSLSQLVRHPSRLRATLGGRFACFSPDGNVVVTQDQKPTVRSASGSGT